MVAGQTIPEYAPHGLGLEIGVLWERALEFLSQTPKEEGLSIGPVAAVRMCLHLRKSSFIKSQSK